MPPGDHSFSVFFAAPLCVAAMTNPGQQVWLNDLYDTVLGTYEGYYEGSVALLCELVMTGNAWTPRRLRRRPVRR